ncbi:MAG: polyprenyl diphosphate synthase [Dehalococcoidia bacterium]|nr:polyprenyl diphosphate synthase [Dehalococcoidia bacterium]
MTEAPPLPRHVAFIMDGNGRWALARGLPRLEGHRAGMETIRGLARHLGKRGIPYVTLYAFSTENWRRPADEIRGLFRLMAQSIKKEARALHENNVRIRHLGRTEGLDAKIVNDIAEAVELTSVNTGLNLSIALNYGGRQELTDALRRLVAAGVKTEDVNEALINAHLDTSELPDVDLLVRTAGEMRISNFLLWQSAYAEYYATPVLWPDFDSTEVDRALADFAHRKRRFGGL